MGDSPQVARMLDLVEGEIASVTADGAYDGAPALQVSAQLHRDREHLRGGAYDHPAGFHSS